MIDADGFRANVGIILANTQGQVLWAKRVGHDSWQFPQGGIDAGESPVDAMYRELYEEVGLLPHHVELLAVTNDWLRYRLPRRFVRRGQFPLCIGQKQKWFLLRLDEPNTQHIRLDGDINARPEFDHWEWVSYWYPLGQVVHFKRGVYRRALQELAREVPLKPELSLYIQVNKSASSDSKSVPDAHSKSHAEQTTTNETTDKTTNNQPANESKPDIDEPKPQAYTVDFDNGDSNAQTTQSKIEAKQEGVLLPPKGLIVPDNIDNVTLDEGLSSSELLANKASEGVNGRNAKVAKLSDKTEEANHSNHEIRQSDEPISADNDKSVDKTSVVNEVLDKTAVNEKVVHAKNGDKNSVGENLDEKKTADEAHQKTKQIFEVRASDKHARGRKLSAKRPSQTPLDELLNKKLSDKKAKSNKGSNKAKAGKRKKSVVVSTQVVRQTLATNQPPVGSVKSSKLNLP